MNYQVMIKNYFKIAWRNLWKTKLFSFINIMGLGLAIPFALLSLLQVVSAFENDNFHPNPDRLERVTTDVKNENGNTLHYASSPFTVADKLKTDYPFVENATYVVREFGWELNNRIKTIEVKSIFVQPSFFNMFAFPIERGRLPEGPNTLVITGEMAKVFFGDADPIGKTLSHPDYGELTITGILKNYRQNTHFKSDVMVSMETYERFIKDRSNYDLAGHTYVLLKQNTKPERVSAALNTLAASINKDHAGKKETLHFAAQQLADISPDFDDLRNNPYVYSITDLSINFAMALGIILLAGFNYTNLTLARSLSRAKEVGIRKVSGAVRYQLFGQFICEAILIAFLALIIGFGVLQLMKRFIALEWLVWEVDNSIALYSLFILFTIFIGMLAGIIPARILSSFQPAKVLKGTISPASFGKIGLRKGLVVVQFVVTACFIFLIANLHSQFKYMATDNENFNRRNIYNITTNGNYKLLANDIAGIKDVERVGLVSVPFGGTTAQCGIKKDKQENNITASYYAVDAAFINNMKLSFAAGKNLFTQYADSATPFVIVNEQALFALGLGSAKEAIGKPVILNNDKTVMIQGVVKNFCYFLYQFNADPLVMQYDPSQFNVLSIQTKSSVSEKDFKAAIIPVWKKYYPHEDLSFSNYAKDLYQRYYPGADMKFMSMVSMIIFIIAIMGLIGIVTYNTEKRIKEIGIRKVLGASVINIVRELSGSFVKLIALSAVICLPLGYIIGHLFINLFTYNNGVDIGLMIGMFAAIFAIALFVIAVKTASAAAVNPVNSLRSE